jgi:hypothetical protein
MMLEHQYADNHNITDNYNYCYLKIFLIVERGIFLCEIRREEKERKWARR